MGWQTEEFGAFHEGRAGPVLADGSEPKPVYLDLGSGSYMPKTSDWWIYDGEMSRPRATHLRGSCSCGWRGTHHYAIDWALLEDDPYDAGTDGPHDDWTRHIDEVEARSIPLPAELEDLLNRIEGQLGALAADAPLAALKAVMALERTTGRIGRDAAHSARDDEVSWETIGKALGLPEKDARSLVTRYSTSH